MKFSKKVYRDACNEFWLKAREFAGNDQEKLLEVEKIRMKYFL